MKINKSSILGFFLLSVLPVQGAISQDSPDVEKVHLIIKSMGVKSIKCSNKIVNCAVTVAQNTGCLLQPGSISITNNSIMNANNIAASSSDPNFTNYIIQNNGCPAQLAPGASCTISFYTNTPVAFTLPSVAVQGTNTNVTYFDMNAILCQTTLKKSITNLNLKASGTSRVITITNTGSYAASGLTVTPLGLPSGTTDSTTCPSRLEAGSLCTITITPGANATSNCNTGIQPTPGTVTVSANNVPTSVQSNVSVLDYGCIYQSGYIFSMDDTTSTAGSIGGKVLSQSDQAANASVVVWASNGASTTDYSYDAIPGIDLSSTAGTGSPSFSSFSTIFGVTYTNTLSLTPSNFSQCNAATDGLCNTNNIFVFYNTYTTNYNIGPAPYTAVLASTPTTYYPVGLCHTLVDGGYTDWYVPAICEMGPASNGSNCTVGIQNIYTNLSILHTSCAGSQCLTGNYWSSTEDTADPQSNAWYQLFNGVQFVNAKSSALKVRCSRVFVP